MELLPTPVDEAVIGPPHGLAWSERIRPDGGSVTFDGPRPRTHYGIALVVVTMIALLLGISMIRSGVPQGRPGLYGAPGTQMATVLLGFPFIITLLAWKWLKSAVSAATIDVDGTTLRVDPLGWLKPTREIRIGEIEYVASETEIETADAGNRRVVESFRWYAVHARLHEGPRVAIAAFRDREHAAFVAQRLHALVERAKVLAGTRRDPTKVVPKPYR